VAPCCMARAFHSDAYGGRRRGGEDLALESGADTISQAVQYSRVRGRMRSACAVPGPDRNEMRRLPSARLRCSHRRIVNAPASRFTHAQGIDILYY